MMKFNHFKSVLFSLSILVLLTIFTFTGCGSKESDISAPGGKGDKKGMMFPVETITVKNEAVTYSIYAVGSVNAFEMVQVTARVSGVVDKVLFAEGSRVTANQVLVEIETQRYRLAVESAKAAYEKARASRADAEAGLNRRKSVVEKNPGLIPGEELESWRTKVQTATAEMSLTEAQLHQAELNLQDAQVRAPVTGIIQTRTVQTGQYIQPGNIMATMIRRDPLLIRFKVPEQDANRIETGMKIFFTVKDDKNAYTAVITHVAGAADESTRMAAVTAEVTDPNKDRLRAGAFAEIQVPVGNAKEAPVIPQSAIRPSEKGFLAYVVKDGKAQERILILGMRTADGRAEIKDGIKAGDILVTRGSEALRPDVPLRITRADGVDVPEKGGKGEGA